LADFGKEGNVLGLFAGIEPTLRGLSASVRPAGGFSRDTSLHLEGFYKYKLTDNISVTPGVIWITSPNQNENNDDIIIGTLRTTFTF
jgi:carbohydrate-selective porin OprB